MSLLELFFPIATVVLAVGCYTCYRTGKPARELLAEKRAAEAKKAAEEVIKLAREESDKEMMRHVSAALKVLFSEARDYSHREEENRRRGYNGFQSPSYHFPQEIREGFHKVLRVSTLETKMDEVVTRVDAIAKHRKDLINQVGEIHKVLKDYA